MVRVKLHGSFTVDYVPEVEKALSEYGCKKGKLALDLMNVTFVDREAMEFLRKAISRKKIAIKNIPSYVPAGLNRKPRDSTSHHRGITSALVPKDAVNRPRIPLFTAFSFRSSV